jgi:hypothetical protein
LPQKDAKKRLRYFGYWLTLQIAGFKRRRIAAKERRERKDIKQIFFKLYTCLNHYKYIREQEIDEHYQRTLSARARPSDELWQLQISDSQVRDELSTMGYLKSFSRFFFCVLCVLCGDSS